MRAFLLLFAFTFLISCNSVRFIDIQVLKPAEIAYPYTIDKLYIVYPQKIAVASNIEIDALFYKQFIDGFTTSLVKKIKESPLLENSEITLIKKDELLKDSLLKSTDEQIKTNICTMESIYLKDSIYKVKNADNWFVRLELRYYINLKIKNHYYNTKSLKIYTLTDTIYWDSESFSNTLDTSNVKIDKNALSKELPEYAADLFATKIAPYWNTQERNIYYSSNSIMKKGYNEFVNNNNEEAIKYWKYIYERGVKNLSSKASFNLALCYETIDSLSLADTWIKKAIAIKPDTLFKNYQRILEIRLKDEKLLNEQLRKTRK